MENWGKFGFCFFTTEAVYIPAYGKAPRPALEAQVFEEYPRPARTPQHLQFSSPRAQPPSRTTGRNLTTTDSDSVCGTGSSKAQGI